MGCQCSNILMAASGSMRCAIPTVAPCAHSRPAMLRVNQDENARHRDQLRAFADDLRLTQGLNFSFRIGMNSSDVVVEPVFGTSLEG